MDLKRNKTHIRNQLDIYISIRTKLYNNLKKIETKYKLLINKSNKSANSTQRKKLTLLNYIKEVLNKWKICYVQESEDLVLSKLMYRFIAIPIKIQ